MSDYTNEEIGRILKEEHAAARESFLYCGAGDEMMRAYYFGMMSKLEVLASVFGVDTGLLEPLALEVFRNDKYM